VGNGGIGSYRIEILKALGVEQQPYSARYLAYDNGVWRKHEAGRVRQETAEIAASTALGLLVESWAKKKG
jgi:hypothetical protein